MNLSAAMQAQNHVYIPHFIDRENGALYSKQNK